MPDSVFGEAAFLSGQEIVNSARTLAYLENGYGPPSMQVNGGCFCSNIRELIECDSEPYVSPEVDGAPWYDASVPESADFAGFLPVEIEGLGSTYSRTSADKITGGAALGRLRPGPRTIIWRGYLFGRSDCAVRFGLGWLTANLAGSGCEACGGEELDILVCCPDLADSPPVSGCSSLPEVNRPDLCPPYTNPDAFRTLKNVGLIDGPKILSQRKTGCGSSCGNDSCEDDTLIMEVEFSLMAGNPYLYGCPVCLCVDLPLPAVTEGDCATDPFWEKLTGAQVAEIAAAVASGSPSPCLGDVCDPEPDCTTTDSECRPADLPTIAPFTDNCFCDPLHPVQTCCPIPADAFSQFFEGAPVIEIFSGSAAMRGTTIRFFENPKDLECCDVSEDACLNCDSLNIRFIPAGATMTIDGTNRTISVLCRGSVVPIRAEHLTVTPFSWPILQCTNYCICIETDGVALSPDATVTVLITPREM